MSTQRYISKELTHFIGRSLASDEERYGLLKHILESGELQNPRRESGTPSSILAAGSALGFAGNYAIRDGGKLSDDDLYFLTTVCFCDIPAEDFTIHMSKYGRVGIAFDKVFLINCGTRPVCYVPKGTRPAPFVFYSDSSSTAELFDRMVPQIIAQYGSEIKGLALGPLSKQMGRFNPRSPTREQASLMKGIQELSFLLSEVFGFIKFYDAATVETDPANFYI